MNEYRRVAYAKNRPTYQWQVGGFAAFGALEDLCNSGLCIKRPQANAMLERRELFSGRIGRAGRLTDSVRQARLALQGELRSLRARMLNYTTSQMYVKQMRTTFSGEDDVCAYAAGFCDADGCFCCTPHGNQFYYHVVISQKNRSFLEAFKEVVFLSKGSNVYTNSTSGVSSLRISRQQDVFQFCSRIHPFTVSKRQQVDIILTMPPGPTARALLQSMHGDQGVKRWKQTRAL